MRAEVNGVTNSPQCEVTTIDPHPFITGQEVRFTDLNGMIKTPPGVRGMDQINNYRFKVITTGDTTFKIVDPITNKYVDSTNFVPWIQGGNITLVTQQFTYYP